MDAFGTKHLRGGVVQSIISTARSFGGPFFDRSGWGSRRGVRTRCRTLPNPSSTSARYSAFLMSGNHAQHLLFGVHSVPARKPAEAEAAGAESPSRKSRVTDMVRVPVRMLSPTWAKSFFFRSFLNGIDTPLK